MALPIQNDTLTRLATALLADTEGPGSFVEVVDAAKLSPQGGVVVVGTGLVGTPSEVIGYTSISGRYLMGLSRGLQGTTAVRHAAQEIVGLVITSEHIAELQVQFGSTAQRVATSLSRADTGFRWFDTDLNELYIWFIRAWVIAAKIYPSSLSLSSPFKEWRGNRGWVLTREYSQGDRWIEDAGNFSLWLCTANTRTNTIADWTEVGVGATGPQGASGPRGPQGITGPGLLGPTGPVGLQGLQGDTGPQGVEGPQGLQGTRGPQGVVGDTGIMGLTGIQGTVGVPGSRGVQGPPGVGTTGPTGVMGPRGVDRTKSLNGVGNLLDRPQAASVPTGYTYLAVDVSVVYTRTATSTWESQAWAPRGPQGQAGIPGVTPGAIGVTGPRGFSGPQGITGIPGVTGSSGSQGPQGQPGVQGPQGEAGLTGLAVTGPQGIQGIVGPQGDMGPEGPPGVRGIKGDPGIAGKPGLPGLDGPKGPRGIPGVEGPPGDKGPAGVAGGVGPKGDVGPLGPPGPTGVQGPDGSTGEIGEDGPPGPTGPRGPAGPMGPAGGNVNGPMGPTGPRGPDGDPGRQGPRGDYGKRGPRGPTGFAGNVYPGDPGPHGEKGSRGPRGKDSDPGATGPRGPTGPACTPPPDTCSDCETHTHDGVDITPTDLTPSLFIRTSCTDAKEASIARLCVGGYEYVPEQVELWSDGSVGVKNLFVRGDRCEGGTPDPLICECDTCANTISVVQVDVWVWACSEWILVPAESGKLLFSVPWGFLVLDSKIGYVYTSKRFISADSYYNTYPKVCVQCCHSDFFGCDVCSDACHVEAIPGAVIDCIQSVGHVEWEDNACYCTTVTLVKDNVNIETLINCSLSPGNPVFECETVEATPPTAPAPYGCGILRTELLPAMMMDGQRYIQNYGPARVKFYFEGLPDAVTDGCEVHVVLEASNLPYGSPAFFQPLDTTIVVGAEPVILEVPFNDYLTPFYNGFDWVGATLHCNIVGTGIWHLQGITATTNPSLIYRVLGGLVYNSYDTTDVVGGTTSWIPFVEDVWGNRRCPVISDGPYPTQTVHEVSLTYVPGSLTEFYLQYPPWSNQGPPPQATLRIALAGLDSTPLYYSDMRLADQLVELPTQGGTYAFGPYPVPNIMLPQYRYFYHLPRDLSKRLFERGSGSGG